MTGNRVRTAGNRSMGSLESFCPRKATNHIFDSQMIVIVELRVLDDSPILPYLFPFCDCCLTRKNRMFADSLKKPQTSILSLSSSSFLNSVICFTNAPQLSPKCIDYLIIILNNNNNNNNNNMCSSQHQTLQVFNRESGLNLPKTFTRKISASEGLLNRMGVAGKLVGHEGCVNTIEFNYCGDRVVSGSDDRRVMLWNVATKSLVLSYDSGHMGNVFQARIMPFTDDRVIVTSGADGQVRLGQLAENGHVETKTLGNHDDRVHKLAVEPGSPHIFYSCGEDGIVQHFDLRSNSSTKLLSCTTFKGYKYHHSPSNILRLNTITIDPRNPNYFSLGGSDEYARVYDIRILQRYKCGPVDTFCPKHLVKTNNIHITGMSYSNTSELLVSYNGEGVYLFQKNMGLGPYPVVVSEEHLNSLEEPQMYYGHRNSLMVKGVSFFGPGSEYVMSGSDCGRIFVWSKRNGVSVRVLEGVSDLQIVNQVEAHPHHIPVLASAGLDKDITLWAPLSDGISPLQPRGL
ncbi:uncharacterized protein LOC143536252 [Bidens hawaiensis]|uniref:uncharacterized protein LOC143536252 n=1 Tax=Bidens hawaiensis TaxID=980011 RepID=UPI00404AF0E8